MFKFIKSASSKENWYQHPYYEVAFWGRSNVGKSSLINAIVSNNKLARVSKTPGRTQLLNFFQNNHGAVLVDLPGYGYAKLSQTQKQQMLLMIEEYIQQRTNLKNIYLLIDSRIGISNTDLPILNFLNNNNIDFKIVFTKVDKLNQSQKSKLIKQIKKDASTFGFSKYFIVSSETKFGINELMHDLDSTLSGEDDEN
ncbi:ribosome biogenesis GTP-binding protein YihA/YsxC [Mycoplasma nasistruthionis]|uniref:Probable GTP-binding protein EngB n=1 Tax=Mycoplasma nasistruthionis TaxID=353852 RepID=A0A4Y6I677_9MOLU|nr:ribosome biogenesis GTP-binding protein YihA/YsxC [Mycoplasma nasistruthionis]QCZ36840.1 YihA family ribosome biogenesis GTP-binding protein [Mycoplasma nasistruthionis]QDF65116.1 YihA family ribosome biogenesis GTP-binding protein [Mycoplasma nasistruthionis]